MRASALALVMAVAGYNTSGGSSSMFIHCAAPADCPASLPMCTPDSHICVGCLADFQTCGPLKTCDEKTHTCVPADPNAPCVRTADCPRPGVDKPSDFVCLLDAGICVTCASNSDCPVGTCTAAHKCDLGDGGIPYDATAATD